MECRLTELEEERLQILSQLEHESKAKEDAEAKAQALYNDVQALNEQVKLQIYRRKLIWYLESVISILTGFPSQMLKLRADHMQEKEDIQVCFGCQPVIISLNIQEGYKLTNIT